MVDDYDIVEITLVDPALGSKELYDQMLEVIGKLPEDITLKVSEKDRYRDPILSSAVLVAVVTSVSSLLSALLGYLAAKQPKGSIIIRDQNGKVLEVPVGATKAEIDKAVEALRQINEPKIVLSQRSEI